MSAARTSTAPGRPPRAIAWPIFAGVAAALTAAAHLADRAAAGALVIDRPFQHDWYNLLRVMGSMWTWLALAGALVLVDLRRTLAPPLRDPFTRGGLLLMASASAGLVAEGLKLVVRRGRPRAATEDTLYLFRPFAENTWSTSGLGMPSSHAAVAFAAAFILARLHPPAAPVLALLAVGCALSRLLGGDHFASDVVAGAAVGVLAAASFWALHARNLRRDALGAPAAMGGAAGATSGGSTSGGATSGGGGER